MHIQLLIKRVLYPRGSSKMEEACDMYVRAANMFKMAKNWCGKELQSELMIAFIPPIYF